MNCSRGHAKVPENQYNYFDKSAGKTRSRCKLCVAEHRTNKGKPTIQARRLAASNNRMETIGELMDIGAPWDGISSRAGYSDERWMIQAMKRKGRKDLLERYLTYKGD